MWCVHTAAGGGYLAALLEAELTRDGTVGQTKAARVKEREWEALELTSLTGGTYVCSLGSLDHSHCSILYAAWFVSAFFEQ